MSTHPALEGRRYRFTVTEFEQMGRSGVFGEDARVELLDGEIVVMSPIGPMHAGTVNRLNQILVRRLGDRAVVAVQNPMRLSDLSEPQPDIVVADRREDFYTSGHPEPGDALLLVEVADSSLAIDRGVKSALYARAGVAEYWIVDLDRDELHVHRAPSDDAYGDTQVLRRGDTVTPERFADVTIGVTEILGE